MFTSSGIFNPADHGLKIGDMLNLICVAGGASGCGYNGTTAYAGNPGGNSSFGNFLSALGGTAPTNNNRAVL